LILTLTVLLVFVFPTRTWLAQRRQLSAVSHRISVLSAQDAAMSAEIDKLHTDGEVARLAREQYHLIKPGEQAYAILPAPETPTTVAGGLRGQRGAPGGAHHHHRSFWERLWGWL